MQKISSYLSYKNPPDSKTLCVRAANPSRKGKIEARYEGGKQRGGVYNERQDWLGSSFKKGRLPALKTGQADANVCGI